MITILILLLLAGGLLLLVKKTVPARPVALGFSLSTLLVSLWMTMQFVPGPAKQFVTNVPWIPSLGIHFHLAADGLSLLLVLLTTIITPLIIWSSFRKEIENPGRFYGLILLMEMALIGVFTAMDGFLFYIFWELALIPIYFICLLWGGDGRARITFKFFLYTMTGSLLMLGALILLSVNAGYPSFDIESLYAAGRALPLQMQIIVFVGMFLAFAVKMPMIPLHTWQPDTYVNAPAEGTMLLSAIMLKMGVYGLLRWLVPVVPDVVEAYAPYLMAIAVAGVVYASCIALVQHDFKRLIAYGSLAHVSLMAAAVFSLNVTAWHGIVIQMLSHGVVVFGLFYMVDMIRQHTGSQALTLLGGIRTIAPVFATCALIIALSNIALPLTSGFPGEFLMLTGIFSASPACAAVGGLTVILGAVYMLKAYQRVFLGEVSSVSEKFVEIRGRDLAVMVVVCLLIFALGLFPNIVTILAGPSVEMILQTK
jgi:NADH-quinone oxidoreductase subunit M